MVNFWKGDVFRLDWLGYINEQLYRTLLGLFIVWIIAVVAYEAVGEMPNRAVIFSTCLIACGTYEYFRFGWRGWDTIEDMIFFVVYGVGGTMITFTGYQAGSDSAVFDMAIALPMLTGFFVHLSIGAAYRMNNIRISNKAARVRGQ